jgi:3-methyladenine DNA glycosylase Tag
MAETVLAKMAVEISANAANFTKQLSQTQSKLNSFTSGLSSMAKTVGIAFGVQQIAGFAFEVAKLAGEAEGVKAAFDKLPNSTALMVQLKEATAGTVSELELMKRTVQATNFGIELQALPKLLEFAAVRAQQTGQSVDYLVDSIVTGIGRKSPLILDNLGISAVALKDKMGGIALATASIGEVSRAVGQIAEDELKKMGGFSENTATKVARLTASWENFKVSLGKSSFVGALSSATEGFLNFFNSLLGGQASVDQMKEGLDFLIKGLNSGELSTETYATAFKEAATVADRLGIKLIKLTDEATGLSKVLVDTTTKIQTIAGPATQQQITTLDALQAKIADLNKQFEETDIVDQKKLANIGAEIIATNTQIKKLEELRKAREKSDLKPDTVNAYQEAIANLNKEIENTNVKDTSRLRILSAQVAGYQDAIKAVDRLKQSFQDLSATVITPPDTSNLLNIDPVVKRFEAGLAAMAASAKTHTDTIKGVFVDMGPLIAGGLSGVAEALGGAIAGVGNFGQDIIKVVASFAKQLGEILIATAVGALALKKFAISHPVAAIAAGVALVALASAAGAAASKAHSATFSGGGSTSVSAPSPIGSRSVSATEAQDVRVSGSIQVRGQDLFVILSNYENNNKFTKATGG